MHALGQRKAEGAAAELEKKARSKRSPEAMRAACVAALARIKSKPKAEVGAT